MAQQHLLFARHGWLKNGSTSSSRILRFPVELLLRSCRNTRSGLEQSRLLDALFAFAGDCSCCFRKHDSMKCDKPPQYLANGIAELCSCANLISAK